MRLDRFIWLVLGLCMLVGFCILTSSCKGVTPALPTNVSSSDSNNNHTENRIDTVYRDRWHTEYMRGDTLIIHDSIDRWRIRNVYIHDSIYNSRIDTIYQQVQVEKKGSAFLQNSGIALWVLIALAVLAAIVGIVLKFAK